jgi:hypothetical protein
MAPSKPITMPWNLKSALLVSVLFVFALPILAQETDSLQYEDFEYVNPEILKGSETKEPQENQRPRPVKKPEQDREKSMFGKVVEDLRFSPNLDFWRNEVFTSYQLGLTVAYRLRENLIVGPGIDFQRSSNRLNQTRFDVVRPLVYIRYLANLNLGSGSQLFIDLETARSLRTLEDRVSGAKFSGGNFEELLVGIGIAQRFSERVTVTLGIAYDVIWEDDFTRTRVSPLQVRQRIFF